MKTKTYTRLCWSVYQLSTKGFCFKHYEFQTAAKSTQSYTITDIIVDVSGENEGVNCKKRVNLTMPIVILKMSANLQILDIPPNNILLTCHKGFCSFWQDWTRFTKPRCSYLYISRYQVLYKVIILEGTIMISVINLSSTIFQRNLLGNKMGNYMYQKDQYLKHIYYIK